MRDEGSQPLRLAAQPFPFSNFHFLFSFLPRQTLLLNPYFPPLPFRVIVVPMADLNPPSQPVKPILKRPLILSTIFALGIVLYVAFVFFTRWESDRTIEKRNAVKAAEEQHANDVAAVQELGGSELAIRAFYLSPPAVYTGESSQLCYDVSNAKSVTLDPPVAEVWPSHTRCIDVSPKKSTKYTLTITDAKGQSTSQSIELKVTARPPVHVKSFPSR